MRRIIALILLTLPTVLFACTSKEMDKSSIPSKPLVDTRVPSVTETATFALG
ncbi:MAG: hypothetical protein V1767_03390 [Chloroflexota bacterium]